jgi:hypothetical protein
MKSVPIANYLEQIARAPGEPAGQRRETSPFRPRSLQTVQGAEPRVSPAFDLAAKLAGAVKPPGEERAQRPLFDRRPAPPDPLPRESLAPRDAAKAEDIALRLAEAHVRGREQGLAEGRAEAEELRKADRIAAREQAATEQLEFQLNEFAQLETAIRSGFARVEENVGAAVVRILSPFLAKQTAKYVADELARTIARLCEGSPPGLITIRGPERLLRLLRERIADQPVEINYVEDRGVEAVVEAGPTHIVTEFRPWAELLASLDL